MRGRLWEVRHASEKASEEKASGKVLQLSPSQTQIQGRPGQQDLRVPRLGRCQATGSCHGGDMGECGNLRGERE